AGIELDLPVVRAAEQPRLRGPESHTAAVRLERQADLRELKTGQGRLADFQQAARLELSQRLERQLGRLLFRGSAPAFGFGGQVAVHIDLVQVQIEPQCRRVQVLYRGRAAQAAIVQDQLEAWKLELLLGQPELTLIRKARQHVRVGGLRHFDVERA